MYIMTEIDFSKFPSTPNVIEFVQLLCKETSVKLMPGSVSVVVVVILLLLLLSFSLSASKQTRLSGS